MVQTRSKAQSRHRLTRAKSNWKHNSPKSTPKPREFNEQEVPIERNVPIATNSQPNTLTIDEEYVISEESLPQTDLYSDEHEFSEDECNDPLTEANLQDSEEEFTELDQEDGGSEPESAELEQELESEYIQEEEDVTQGLNTEKKVIHFNEKGQPVGEGSLPFTSKLGSIARKNCPVSYKTWQCVPRETKDFLWKLVTDKYVIPAIYKAQVLIRMCGSWKRYKSVLRTKYYDAYNTDEERKRKCPSGVAQAVWNKFVDNQSTPAAQALRICGRNARRAMNAVHFSGRNGAARVAEALKKRNPSGTVSRTELYLALHSRADGSCPTPGLAEKLEKIKAIATKNPSSINLDVDHDPVAQVCGRERSGHHVRGMGAGVSKKSLRHSALALHHLLQERRLRIAAEKQLAELRVTAGCPEPIDTPHSLRGVSKASLRHSAIAMHHLQREKELRITAEKQLSDLREKMVSPAPAETPQGVSPEPVETHLGVSPEPVETHKGISPEPVETHSSGTHWFQNTPLLRKRKSITEPNKSDYEMGSNSKKRKEFEDADVGMDCEDKEDVIGASNEDEQETELMEPAAFDVASDKCMTGRRTSQTAQKDNPKNFSVQGNDADVNNENSKTSIEQKDGLDTALAALASLKHTGSALSSQEVLTPITEKSSSVSVTERLLDNAYHWAKYGQKDIKGSEFPSIYYRCTYPNCHVKMQLEKSHDGRIKDIVYTGKHDHPKIIAGMPIGAILSLEEDSFNRTSNISDKSSKGHLQTSGLNSIPKGDMGDGDGTLVVKTPRVIVETLSEVDVVDDGYRWRKYGVKMVKGNSHPRNYYRCTNDGCSAKKHVQRAANNPRSIMTIYEGKHNHVLPLPRFTIHDSRGTIISSREEVQDETDKDKDKGCKKSIKVNKEEGEKIKMTTAANAAAQVAVGQYDMLSQWRLMAKQARQQRSASRLMVKQALKKYQAQGSS